MQIWLLIRARSSRVGENSLSRPRSWAEADIYSAGARASTLPSPDEVEAIDARPQEIDGTPG